ADAVRGVAYARRAKIRRLSSQPALRHVVRHGGAGGLMAFLHPADLGAAGLAPAVGTPPGQARRLTCAVVSDPAKLDGLASAWAELLERSADNRPMLSPTWLLPWWRVYAAGRKLRIGLFRDGNRLVGLAPLLYRRCWVRRCLPFRRLESLGAD